MKTILIAHNYSENSFASMSFYLAHHLAALGHRVIFISHKPFFDDIKNIKKDKGEIIICSWSSAKRPTSIKDIFWFSKIYLKYKPNVVIGHFVGANIAVGISKLFSFGKVKTFIYYHTLVEQINKDQKKKVVKNRLLFYRKIIFYKLFCNTVVCPSGLAKKDLEKFYHSKKGFVILNPMQDRFLAKNNLEANTNRIIISYLGRLDPSKGVLELIRAFKIYRKENKSSNIILNIAGTGSQVDEIKKMINDQDNILYFGGLPYDKVDAYLSQSHFVIIPSKIDNLPTVGLEAMMNGTPLLISKNVGLSDYLEDERACFKFEPHQESMVLLFKKVETNFFQQVQMGKEARNTFLNKFSIRNYCHCFSEIIVKK